MEYKDYYATLGINKKASQEDVKKAYRRLARKYHPDVSKEKNAEEQFKNVQEAYEVLKDPEKRSAYDQLGSNWKSGQDFRPPPGWGDAHTQFRSSRAQGFAEEDLGGFSDFFANLFGGGGGRTQHFQREDFGGFKQRGGDQHAKINITLDEAFHGVKKMVQLQVPEMSSDGMMQPKIRTLNISIPAGTTQGKQLRLTGQGMAGMGGGPAGDLYLEIDILPHTLFSLKERDVYLTLPVTPWEAALGAEIKIPTLGGPVGLKLSPNSQSGQKLRLKGRGMPGKTPGDQYAVLQVVLPPANTEEQKQVYENMARIMPFNPRKGWPA